MDAKKLGSKGNPMSIACSEFFSIDCPLDKLLLNKIIELKKRRKREKTVFNDERYKKVYVVVAKSNCATCSKKQNPCSIPRVAVRKASCM